MIRLTERQTKAHLLANPDALLSLAAEHVREEHGRLLAWIDQASVREMTANALIRGRKAGLTDPEDLCAFAALSWSIAPDFDEHPQIRRALQEVGGRPGPVMDDVLAGVSEAAWEEAAARYDETAWYSEDEDMTARAG